LKLLIEHESAQGGKEWRNSRWGLLMNVDAMLYVEVERYRKDEFEKVRREENG